MNRYLKTHLQVAILLVTLFGTLVINHSLAQLKMDTVRSTAEDGWIEKMDNYLGFKMSMSNDIETFKVDTDAQDFDLYPNTTTIGHLHLNYRNISIGYSFSPDFFPGNGDEAMKGKTKSFGFSGGFNFTHWFQNLSYSRVQGYYLNNSKDFPSWTPGDPYLQVPDLVVKNFEGLTGYSFNSKFSVKSITTQTERQVKSAGSFIPIVGYRIYIVDDRDKNATSTQKSNNFEFVIGAGYHYNFIIKENFYFSVGFTPGLGYIFTKLTTRQPGDDLVSKSKAPIVRADGRSALGYNGRRFFAGAVLTVAASTFEQEGTTAINSDTRATYQVFIGFRMNAPEALRTGVDKLNLK